MKRKRCPFCDGADLKTQCYPAVFTATGYWTECQRCSATGPEAATSDEADKKWNERQCRT